MKTVICICASLVLYLPSFAFAGDKHKGGGKGGGGGAAKAAHAGGGGGGAGRGARFGGAGGGGRGPGAHMGGGAQHNVGAGNLHNAGHAQHGLNAHQGGGHGLNAHQGARHGVNAGTNKGLQGRRTANVNRNVNRRVNNRFVGRNRFAGHWRSGLRWRNTHALYAGYRRAWHDRWWWGAHYNNVVFVGGPYWGGHWYWDGGYWFPAWGYAPGFVYGCDCPIYAYANLPPDQVVVNVQEALQDQGYYRGDVDGQLGTQTRDALAAYQRDHELEVSAAIDEPTVQSLGLANEEA